MLAGGVSSTSPEAIWRAIRADEASSLQRKESALKPILIDLGPLSIHSYGLMLAIAFLVGIGFVMRRMARYGVDTTPIADLAIVVLLSAVAGARLMFVLFHLSDYIQRPLDVFVIWKGGLQLYGGLIPAIIAGAVFLRLKRLPLGQVADSVAMAFFLGVFFTRIGCFLNGCCFGHPTDMAWGVRFPAGCAASYFLPGQRLHPTQLYSALAGLATFGLLLALERWSRKPGVIFSAGLVLYGLGRTILDFFRFYEESNVVMRLDSAVINVNQIVSLALIVAGVVMMAMLMRRGGKGLREP